MNRNAIRITRDLIAASATWPAECGKFDMNVLHCGTAACIAGFAWAASNGYRDSIPNSDHFHAFDTETEAAAFLGLGRQQRTDLFFPEYAALNFSPYHATPEQAVAVLNHLLATGEVDWSAAQP